MTARNDAAERGHSGVIRRKEQGRRRKESEEMEQE